LLFQKFVITLIPNPFLLLEAMFAHGNSHLSAKEKTVLYCSALPCAADRNEQVGSLCCNQQVLTGHKTVAQITPCMQARYKTSVYADGFNP